VQAGQHRNLSPSFSVSPLPFIFRVSGPLHFRSLLVTGVRIVMRREILRWRAAWRRDSMAGDFTVVGRKIYGQKSFCEQKLFCELFLRKF
jgi:hypothetical protein